MENEHWLSLTDYSNKHQVSVSTLRRKIKSGQLEHRLQDGRYVILEALGLVPELSDEPLQPTLPIAPPASLRNETLPADQLLQEIKRAYTNILHEKEQQIIDLKEEVVDLKTLVHALENDNQRLRRKYGESL